MTRPVIELELANEAATIRAGADLALALKPGDCLALHGDLGAGKTTLARAVIRHLAGDPALEVPSPTFTLVQAYDSEPPIAHFDLYRLGASEELRELGLDDYLGERIVLVEWPDRAGDLLPDRAIHVKLSDRGEGRMLAIEAPEPAAGRLARSFLIRDFLGDAGRGDATRRHLTGDASTRAYETVHAAQGDAILMNAPRRPDGPPIRDGKPYSRIAHLAESVTPFVAIAGLLHERGFCAPDILHADLEAGLLLIEDLGREGVLDRAGRPQLSRYEAAAALLADMHRRAWPAAAKLPDGTNYPIPAYDRAALHIETELLIDWYVPYRMGREATAPEKERYRAAWAALFDHLDGAEKSLVLRDYHSPNIIWRAHRAGNDRIGLIDFQDALIGPCAYDVASLAMDARVDIAPAMEAAIVSTYVEKRSAAGAFDAEAFALAYAVMAAQRNSKILGIFVRLDRRDGKPGYLRHLPRIRAYLDRATRHPALAELRALYAELGILEPGA